MQLVVRGLTISNEELDKYVQRGCEMYPNILTGMEIDVEEDDVKITYHVSSNTPFERIRRITGYLVGTTEKWNNAKQSEEKDRVKHDYHQ